jgi:nucleotide-binding universal stress UspA family protein
MVQQLADTGLIQLIQWKMAVSGVAAQILEGCQQGMPALHFYVAIGADDEERHRRQVASEIAQELQAARVGPLQVVQEKKPGTRLGSALDELRQVAHQAQLLLLGFQRRGFGQGGQHLVDFGNQPDQITERLASRFIRQLGGNGGKVAA